MPSKRIEGDSVRDKEPTEEAKREDVKGDVAEDLWPPGILFSPARWTSSTLLSVVNMAAQDLIIIAILVVSAVGVSFVYSAVHSTEKPDSWIVSLIFNMLGYATIVLPGYLVIEYVKRTGYLDKPGPKCLDRVIRICIRGSEDTIGVDDSVKEDKTKSASSSTLRTGLHVAGCVLGLQVSYLTWGVLQEKIMTQKYVDSTGEIGQFKDSQFLVFVNRILAFATALLVISFTRQPRHRAPLYKYSFCSFSNIMSSWCQYEALKYVSFPTQVLTKASKIIPVMIMGKIVSKRKYETYEYLVAVMISIGMVLFLFGSQEPKSSAATSTTFSGAIILFGYMAADSFTSNWQSELFDTYKMSSFQMMAGVNLFSCLFTFSSLFQQGTFFSSLVFMSQYPAFAFDCVVLSLCSAIGQLFIYHTISSFGAVVFVIIMTLRQAIAILLSCIIYQHPLSAIGVIGVFFVFGAMSLKIYCGYRLKKLRKARESGGNK